MVSSSLTVKHTLRGKPVNIDMVNATMAGTTYLKGRRTRLYDEPYATSDLMATIHKLTYMSTIKYIEY